MARKSIVTIKKIKKGEYFTEENLGIKRPGNGISPYSWEKILGTKSSKNYKDDILLK